jgi:hypothetical protein
LDEEHSGERLFLLTFCSCSEKASRLAGMPIETAGRGARKGIKLKGNT